MTEEAQTEIIIGLSEEEKEDLEELIKTIKEDQSVELRSSTNEDVQKQIRSMGANLAHLGDILLKIDDKMKSFYEIIRLSCKKDEMLNKRIDAIIEIMRGRRNL
jgi:TRAP-type C4-dicarboxylate transport system substrate-binding protein